MRNKNTATIQHWIVANIKGEEMMKVAIIMGSPRKKDTFNICKQIESQVKLCDQNVEFDYIFLKEHHIKDCIGCNLCFQQSENDCPCHDDLNDLKKRLFAADGLIIASPVYAYQVTGQLKRFIDRMSFLFHRQELVGKPALIVITSDGGGNKAVYKYLKMTLSGWGADIVGSTQIIAPVYFKDRQPKGAFGYDEYYYEQNSKKIAKLSKCFHGRLATTQKKQPSFYDVFMFNCLRSKTYTSKIDRTYWEQKGWLDASYFYPTPMNPAKRIFGSIIRGIVHMAGKRYLEK